MAISIKSLRNSGYAGVATILNAMCDGLIHQSKRKNFKVDMDSFGGADGMLCFGCAATCALQELHDVNFTVKNIDSLDTRARAVNMGITEDDLDTFEGVVDDARRGNLHWLYTYCGLDLHEAPVHGWYMINSNWRKEIPKVRRFVEKLVKEHDLEWIYE